MTDDYTLKTGKGGKRKPADFLGKVITDRESGAAARFEPAAEMAEAGARMKALL